MCFLPSSSSPVQCDVVRRVFAERRRGVTWEQRGEHPASRQTRQPGLPAGEAGRQPWQPSAGPSGGATAGKALPLRPAPCQEEQALDSPGWHLVLVGANGAQSPAVGSLAYTPVPVAHARAQPHPGRATWKQSHRCPREMLSFLGPGGSSV